MEYITEEDFFNYCKENHIAFSYRDDPKNGRREFRLRKNMLESRYTLDLLEIPASHVGGYEEGLQALTRKKLLHEAEKLVHLCGDSSETGYGQEPLRAPYVGPIPQTESGK